MLSHGRNLELDIKEGISKASLNFPLLQVFTNCFYDFLFIEEYSYCFH